MERETWQLASIAKGVDVGEFHVRDALAASSVDPRAMLYGIIYMRAVCTLSNAPGTPAEAEWQPALLHLLMPDLVLRCGLHEVLPFEKLENLVDETVARLVPESHGQKGV